MWIIGWLATAWAGPTLLTPEQQREDLDALWAELQRIHPSLDLYTPAPELAAIVRDVRAGLDTPRTAAAFSVDVMHVLEPIGCGHTSLHIGPFGVARAAGDIRFLDLDFVPLDDVLYLDPRGHGTAARVVEIDGVPGEQILTDLRAIASADGRTVGGKDDMIDAHGARMYAQLYGHADTASVVVEDLPGSPGAGQTRTLTVGVTGPDGAWGAWGPTSYQGETRYQLALVSPIGALTPDPRPRDAAGQVVLITFDEFPAPRRFRRKILRPLDRVLAHEPAAVIFDIRRNSGGRPGPLVDLLGRFVDETAPMYERSAMTMEAAESMGLVLGSLHVHGEVRGGLLWRADGSLFRPVEPVADDPWTGALVVLAGRATFSTATDFAAFVRREGLGVVVGQTTGSAWHAQTAGRFGAFHLPHSDLQVHIPMNRTLLADPLGVMPVDVVGVPPDIEVHPAPQSVAGPEDPDLRAALEHLARER